MSQILYLLRHAEAEPWSPLGNDFSRSLSPDGASHAHKLSDWARENLAPPDTILCSPAQRTRLTLAPILSHWHRLLANTHYLEPMYGASASLLLTLVEDAFSYSKCLLIVGHNPGIETLLRNVLPGPDSENLNHYAPGTLSVINFPDQFKRESQKGQLTQLVTGRDLSQD